MGVYGGSEKFNFFEADGSSIDRPAPSLTHLVELGKTTNGFYWVNPQNNFDYPIYIYVDFNYRTDEAFALVQSNRRNTTGIANSTTTPDGVNSTSAQTKVSFNNAVNNINYKGSYGNTNLDFNAFIGVKYWQFLGKELVQFVSTSTRSLNETSQHTKRYRWRYRSMNTTTYAFSGVSVGSDETGTGQPGFYSHAASAYGLTTYDNDQDVHSGNCSTFYNNAPFWYSACWSGNVWGGMGGSSHADAYFWNSSGSDNHNYGAIYIG